MSEVKKFVNEYSYSEAIIKEAITARWYDKTKKSYIGIVLFAILMLVLFFIKHGFVYLIFGVLFILMILGYEFMKSKSIKSKMANASVLYKNKKVNIWVKIEEEIKVISPDNKGEFYFSSIDKILNTQNLIILVTKNGKMITMTKNGFKEGDAEECYTYLKGKVK